ncbi:TonB-dependent receptor [Pseudoxanthomonas sangjuensis]|uniref:TonB-dependent receptor n=1 Tax=Pseudoxanthomonas sangjuensis TaxID=1503750 RepID=UPI001391C769|nr:TonB-dependent receptor [Pseudoxanthomonas sangjuensis]
MLQLKRNVLCVALASAMTLGANAAYAQQAGQNAEADQDQAKKDDAVNLDKVTVTGIRSAIEKSIDTKQTSTSIVEAISAEDIGKLPDASIADSIARLPGLTAQRERGRATQINVRGFAGDFATATLNGREQASTGDNRGVEFDQYPSELLSSVTVYKTPDASLVGQGLSGTVDMHTVRPLSYDERVMSFNARYDQNKIRDQKENGYRATATYIDQFMDKRLGLMLAVSKMDSPQPGYQNELWGYAGGPDGTTVLGGGKLYKFDNNHDRTGVAATLQFKPNDFYEGTLDWFHSKFEKTEIKTGMEFGTIWGTGVLQPGYTVSGNDTITESTWDNVHPVIRMDSNPIEDKLDSIGFNNKFKINDNWTINADLSTSKVDRAMRFLETYAGPAANDGATTAVVSLDPSHNFYNYVLGVDLGDPAALELKDNGGWGQDGYVKDFAIEDKIEAFRLNAIRSIDEGAVSGIDFGINYSKRTKQKSSREAKLCIEDCVVGEGGVRDSLPFPGSSSEFNFGGFENLGYIDANTLLNSGVYNLVGNFHKDIAAKNWSIEEKQTTLYFKADIDADLWGKPLRGNAGFQQVIVEQSSNAFSTFEGNPAGTPITEGIHYSVFLPSMNLGWEFLPETVLRFAAAKQMARPRMDQMKAGMDVSICDTGCPAITNPDGSQTVAPYWSAGGGNPKLKPWLANAFDLSLEKYFSTEAGNRGYFGVAWFHKDLLSWIRNEDQPFDFAGLPLPAQTPDMPNYPTTTNGKINQPVNGQGGTIHGVELTASVPLDLLWKPLNGLGIIATYSDTESSIRPNGAGTSEPMSGLSKYVSNITAYYERGGFSVRFSQRKRSAFRGETRGFGADYQVINIAPETVQDAQVNYSFSDTSALKGLSLYLQVSNIGDEPFATYESGDPSNRPVSYFEYGRTTLAGFSYKF